jgi:hypothetical protein
MDKDIVPEWRNDTYTVIYFMQLSVVSTSTTSSPLPHPDPDRPLDWRLEWDEVEAISRDHSLPSPLWEVAAFGTSVWESHVKADSGQPVNIPI